MGVKVLNVITFCFLYFLLMLSAFWKRQIISALGLLCLLAKSSQWVRREAFTAFTCTPSKTEKARLHVSSCVLLTVTGWMPSPFCVLRPGHPSQLAQRLVLSLSHFLIPCPSGYHNTIVDSLLNSRSSIPQTVGLKSNKLLRTKNLYSNTECNQLC